MSEPIVFISHFGLKEGKLEGFKQYFREGATVLDAEKPRTAAFLAYFDTASGHLAIVHVFPDAAAMELRFEGASEPGAGGVRLHHARRIRDLWDAEPERPRDDAERR